MKKEFLAMLLPVLFVLFGVIVFKMTIDQVNSAMECAFNPINSTCLNR